MNKRLILKYIGYLLVIEGVFMIPSVGIALYNHETSSLHAFLFTIIACIITGTLFIAINNKEDHFYAKEGFCTVALSWIIMSIFGALPLYVSGAIPSYVDCFFEIVSGFTTTGATILPNVETLPRSLIYWRSFTHWLGGMGVLVFILAIVPLSYENGTSLHILRAESPGPVVGKLVPRMHTTARILYAIYVALTLTEIILLKVGGMPLFDSVTVSFGTVGTGGFGITNNSIAAYDSYYLQGIITVFMILCGVNFNIFYLLLMREFKLAFKNLELRVYLGVIFVSTLLITWNTFDLYDSAFAALHHSAFQVASIITTTGYSTVDFNLWPEFSKMILFILMFIGASAGSTGGGIKVSRYIIMYKSIKNEMKKLIHPRSVKLIRMDGKILSNDTMHSVSIYFGAYLAVFSVSILIVSLDNFSFVTTVSAVAACLNNIGPGFDVVGPMGNFGSLSTLSKLVLSVDMLIGRLEIFPMLLLFSPSLWIRSK